MNCIGRLPAKSTCFFFLRYSLLNSAERTASIAKVLLPGRNSDGNQKSLKNEAGFLLKEILLIELSMEETNSELSLKLMNKTLLHYKLNLVQLIPRNKQIQNETVPCLWKATSKESILS